VTGDAGGGLPLRTRRLLIREFSPADAAAVQRYSANPAVVRYLEWGPNRPAETRAFLRRTAVLRRRRPRAEYELAVVRRADGVLIGGVGLRVSDPRSRGADIGYILDQPWWGQGLITEAVRALLVFGFGRLCLHRIWAACDVRNRGSSRVMEKVGMKREGLSREDTLLRGRWRSSYRYAILEPEWRRRSAR